MYGDASDILGDDSSRADTTPSASSKKQNVIFNKSLTDVDKKTNRKGDANIKRPSGMHRELFNLLVHQGKDNKIHSLVPSNTKKGYTSAKAKLGLRNARKWIWRQFVNPGRKDDLQLFHWEREDQAPDKVYIFAKLNKTVEPVTFSDSEYYDFLEDPKWSKQETSHLLEICHRFDLRWPIIEDRFDRLLSTKGRKCMEDMKERYYTILNILRTTRGLSSQGLDAVASPVSSQIPQSASQLSSQADTPDTATKSGDLPFAGYDAEHEKRRKEQLRKLWERTEEQVKEEEDLKAALKRIEAKRKERERKAYDLQRLINATDRTSLSPDSAAGAVGSAGRPNRKLKIKSAQAAAVQLISPTDALAIRFHDFRTAGPHLRSQEMKLPSNIGQKKQKNIDTVIEKLKLDIVPHGMEEIVELYNSFRSNVVVLQDLKTALLAAETELDTLNARLKAENKRGIVIESRMRVSETTPEGAQNSTSNEFIVSPTRAKASKTTAPGAPTSSRRITCWIDVNPAGLSTAVNSRKRKTRQISPSDSGTPPPIRSRQH